MKNDKLNEDVILWKKEKRKITSKKWEKIKHKKRRRINEIWRFEI